MGIVNFNARPKFPKLDISSATCDSLGNRSQDVKTANGKVCIMEYPWYKVAKGTPAALAAIGVIRNEWLPGYKTNNKFRQTIAFSRSGAWLVFGGQRTGRRMVEGVPYMKIEKVSAELLTVKIDYTDSEQREINDHYQAWIAKEERKSRQQFQENYKRKMAEEANRMNLAEWRAAMVKVVNVGLDVALSRIGEGRYRYSDEAMNRILFVRDKLLSEIENAPIIPKAEYPSCKVVSLYPA